MQQLPGQMSIFDLDMPCGKMFPEHSAATKERILGSSSKNSAKLQTKQPMFLDLRKENGTLVGASWGMGIPSRGECLMRDFGESPSEEEESGLSQILEANVPQRYLLSEKACLGVLRRSKNRGKPLPFILNLALTQQIKRGNKNYGEKEIAHAAEILRELWEEVGEETFIKWIRRTVILLQSEEILFPEMCKHCNWEGKSEKGYDISENKPCASKEKHSICTLCFMRENRIYRSSSYRQKPIEQLSKQLDSLMQKLSCKTAPVEGLVLCLRRAGEGAAFMFKALPTIQEVLEKRERSSRIYNKSTAKNAGNVICFSQDAYDKYEETEHGASLKASGGNYGGGSENLVCAGFSAQSSAEAGLTFNENLSPTLQVGKCAAVVTGKAQYVVRRLTPLECCRLQGMPDFWTDGVEGSDADRYKLWGNGMALPNALYIMEGF